MLQMLIEAPLLMAVYFFLLFLMCTKIDLNVAKYNKLFLLFLCTCLVFIAGTRSLDWPDTYNYFYIFNQIPAITDFSFNFYGAEYREEGFLILTSLLKVISESQLFYFTLISAIITIILYCCLRKYCVYPLIGLFIYISRFFLGRDMMQIRSALAYVIVFYFTYLLSEKKHLRFCLAIIIASSFHYSALIVLPAVVICKVRWSAKMFIVLIPIIFIGALNISDLVIYILSIPGIHQLVRTETYTDPNTFGQAGSLMNPMIYFQLGILLLYIYKEKDISQTDSHYFVIRTLYMLGLIILISFQQFATIAGRVSTVFATYEIVMVPSILATFNNKAKRSIVAVVIILIYSIIFYINCKTKLQFV